MNSCEGLERPAQQDVGQRACAALDIVLVWRGDHQAAAGAQHAGHLAQRRQRRAGQVLDHLGEDHRVELGAVEGQRLLVEVAVAHIDAQRAPQLGALIGEQVDAGDLVAGAPQDGGELAGRGADLEHARGRGRQRAQQRPKAVAVQPEVLGLAVGGDAAAVGFDDIACCRRIMPVWAGWGLAAGAAPPKPHPAECQNEHESSGRYSTIHF